jgi:hypothetical protein
MTKALRFTAENTGFVHDVGLPRVAVYVKAHLAFGATR